jgi:hypothetical protein
LPLRLAWEKTRARDLVRALAPDLAIVWTEARTDETTAVYRQDPLTEGLGTR